ncbi:Protein translocase subunit SecA, chloroplastic [Sesbania bispinosa]|nr:Protein translocase subunit SecA, chloroplastic [Sesbania bispinosa]
MHKTRRPMLVGTTGVEQSDSLLEQLKEAGIPHEVKLFIFSVERHGAGFCIRAIAYWMTLMVVHSAGRWTMYHLLRKNSPRLSCKRGCAPQRSTQRACKFGSQMRGHLSSSSAVRFSGDFLETSRAAILFSKCVGDFRSFGYVYLVSSAAFLAGITKAASDFSVEFIEAIVIRVDVLVFFSMTKLIVKHVKWECVPDNPASEVFNFSCGMPWQWSLNGRCSLLDGTYACSLGWMVNNVSLASKELPPPLGHLSSSSAMRISGDFLETSRAWVTFEVLDTCILCLLPHSLRESQKRHSDLSGETREMGASVYLTTLQMRFFIFLVECHGNGVCMGVVAYWMALTETLAIGLNMKDILLFISLDGEQCITCFERTPPAFVSSRAPPPCASVEIFLRQVGLRYCLANEWVTSEVLDMCILFSAAFLARITKATLGSFRMFIRLDGEQCIICLERTPPAIVRQMVMNAFISSVHELASK